LKNHTEQKQRRPKKNFASDKAEILNPVSSEPEVLDLGVKAQTSIIMNQTDAFTFFKISFNTPYAETHDEL